MKSFYILLILSVIIFSIFLLYQKYPVNPPLKLVSVEIDSIQLKLKTLNIPNGFCIDVFAKDVENARSMDVSPSGVVYVGTRSEGNVYALIDENKDYKIDNIHTLLKGGNMPNGVAFKDGDLYVAEVNRILRYKDIESKLSNPGEPEIILDDYPTEKHHGWKYISFGPDGKLYVPVGAPCNICDSKEEIYASITRINPDGSGREIVAHGVRNSVGFDWNPKDNTLWFTDNGRDLLGDDKPECELNHLKKEGQHFGYPYCHQGEILDPEFGKGKNCNDYTSPIQKMGPHTAPLGLEFYKGEMFPKEYQNVIFIARHGSWNRSEKIGYDIVTVEIDENGNSKEMKPFITGWLSEDRKDVWGRPVDIEVLKDGSMLISDDFANMIYRVTYCGK